MSKRRPANPQLNPQGCPQVPAFIRRSPSMIGRIEASLPACILNILVETLLDSTALTPRQRAFYQSLVPDLVAATDGPFMSEARPIRERLVEIAAGVARYAISRNGFAKDPLPVLLAGIFWMEPIVYGRYQILHQGPRLFRVYGQLCDELVGICAVERLSDDFLVCGQLAEEIVPVIQQRLEGLGFFVGAGDAPEAVAA